MKKNFRVIQINGFRGLFLAIFAVSCLIAGFIAFPSFLSMNAWNYLSATTGSFPVINFGESVLLWAIILFSVFIFNKKKFIVSFKAQQDLTDDEVKAVVEKIKAQKKHMQLMQPNDLNSDKQAEENPESAVVQGENK